MIDSKILNKFLKEAKEKLSGDWVIIGGTVLPLLGIDYRVTIDIDFIKLDFNTNNNETIQLMDIAQKLGLPVESINQAGAYFLSKLDEVEDHLILIEKSKKCRIFRPDIYLFFKLKLERMTETDFEDCLEFIKHFPDEYLIHQKKINHLVKQKMKSASAEKKEKFYKLLKFTSGNE